MTLTLSLQADSGIILASLSAIETGAKTKSQEKADFKVGAAGEISRYQILPSVWRDHNYSASRISWIPETNATNPDSSFLMAERIISSRATRFKQVKGRDPSPFEIYVLWHRPQEAYSGRIKARTKERAGRFENLYYALMAEKK
jgi:hypothetical protein